MDIKNGPEKYATTAGVSKLDMAAIEETMQFLLQGSVSYEFRTTVVAELHDEKSMQQMGKWLYTTAGARVKRLFLQSFVDRDTVAFAGLHPCTGAQMAEFVRILEPFAEFVKIRGNE